MNFKLSDNQKYNMLWTLLNPRFNEENEYIMDYAVCDIYDEYAVVFGFENNSYERAYYTKDDATDSLSIDKMEVCYIVDVNENEKHALEVLHAMNGDTYEKADEFVTNLQNEVNSFSSKNEENEATITTLQQDNETLQQNLTEATENYNTALEKIDALTTENETLQSFKDNAELQEKEAVIEKYANLLEDEDVKNFKENIDDYTKEELDRELAFVLVQTKANIFSLDEDGFVPKDEPQLTGVEATLERYKNKKK